MIKYVQFFIVTLLLIVFGFLMVLYFRGFGLLALVVAVIYVQRKELHIYSVMFKDVRSFDFVLLFLLIVVMMSGNFLFLKCELSVVQMDSLNKVTSLTLVPTVFDQYIHILNTETPALGTVMSNAATAPHKIAVSVKNSPQKYIAIQMTSLLMSSIFVVCFVILRGYIAQTQHQVNRAYIRVLLGGTNLSGECFGSKLLIKISTWLMFAFMFLAIFRFWLPQPDWSLMGSVSLRSARWSNSVFVWLVINYSILWIFSRFLYSKFVVAKEV
ncbi:MAG: hypothetical protein COA43_10875 [Robiginitomaculum sp.]|nr:MAG: hypothetical protein COA43_10875 [Robiginitomaculum sp.]